jgi:hypothetical protein
MRVDCSTCVFWGDKHPVRTRSRSCARNLGTWTGPTFVCDGWVKRTRSRRAAPLFEAGAIEDGDEECY